MNYAEARAYVEAAKIYSGDMGLTPIKNLLEKLGNPQDSVDFIHIAGTNGKGSVASFISSVLQSAAYRVGRYISPTLYSYRERIQVNGEYISREAYASYAGRIKEAIDRMETEGLAHPSPFDIETAMAFMHFKEEICDIVVLECGMGGLLDSTNVIKRTLLALLTSISMDHVGILGKNLTEITQTKAGIIKPGSIVVTGRQVPQVEETIWAICTESGNPLVSAKPQEALVRDSTLDYQTFRYHGKEIRISLPGSHQIDNAVLALDALLTLQTLGWTISDDALLEGFVEARWDGRFTPLRRRPYFIVDGAHNPDAALRLQQSLQMYFPENRKVFIVGMFKDKDYRQVAQIMAPLAEQIYTITPPDLERGLPAEELARVISDYNPRVEACGSLEEAIRKSMVALGEDDLVLSFGSLSFIGEITAIVNGLDERF